MQCQFLPCYLVCCALLYQQCSVQASRVYGNASFELLAGPALNNPFYSAAYESYGGHKGPLKDYGFSNDSCPGALLVVKYTFTHPETHYLYSFKCDGVAVTYGKAIALLKSNERDGRRFRGSFYWLVRQIYNLEDGSGKSGAFLKAVGVNKDTLDRVFEFKIYPTTIRRSANPHSFSMYWSKSEDHYVRVFNSYGYSLGHPRLVCPDPEKAETTQTQLSTYHHVMSFFGELKNRQRKTMWNEMRDLLQASAWEVIIKLNEIGDGDFVYLNTHGNNVPWLHMRVEDAATYYTNAAFKEYYNQKTYFHKNGSLTSPDVPHVRNEYTWGR